MSLQRQISVRPRYTPGSPAGVDATIAEDVCRHERAAYEAILQGYEGEERQAMARRNGLARIVYQLEEDRGEFVALHDWLTGETIRGKLEVAKELAVISGRCPASIDHPRIRSIFEGGDDFLRREILALKSATNVIEFLRGIDMPQIVSRRGRDDILSKGGDPDSTLLA